MHYFQPYPTDLLEINPFTKISDEWMLIAAGNQEKVNAMTASWGGLGYSGGKMLLSSLFAKTGTRKYL